MHARSKAEGSQLVHACTQLVKRENKKEYILKKLRFNDNKFSRSERDKEREEQKVK